MSNFANRKQKFMQTTRQIFLHGVHDGIPIAMGYYAVAFSLGIIAQKVGIEWMVGYFGSFFTRASAGEYGVYTLMAASAPYLEVVLMCCITNLRYLLMSTALSQKFYDSTAGWKRLLVACCVTDEIFGISIVYPGNLPPAYTFGAALVSTVCWAAGTSSGIILGDILPQNIVTALSVALYGMFIAIIIPPAKEHKTVGIAVLASFVFSGLFTITPYLSELSVGMRTIVLTVVISSIAAYVKPIKLKEDE